MSMPEPMRCIATECESPLRCSNAGVCIETRKDSYLSWSGAIKACREQGKCPESWRNETKREERT